MCVRNLFHDRTVFKGVQKVEEFDKDTKVKEKGRTSVNFWDKDLNFSPNSEQPSQVHQNYIAI